MTTAAPRFETERRIRAFIAAHFAEEVAFLGALVRKPSDNPPGDCAPHALHTAALLEAMGLAPERYPVPEALCRAEGMISAINLVLRHRFGPGPVIALNAHGDVVPPGGGWTADPYGAELRDGALYGRGAAVSKSDIATYAFALRALAASGAALAGSIELHVTYDEEAGGHIGPLWLLEQGVSRPDLAICAGFTHHIVTAHNGCLHLEVELRGRAAHAADPESGHDALEAATHVLARLYAERDRLRTHRSAVPGIGAAALTVGLISGGINTNVVPDCVRFRLDRRILPEEDPAMVERVLSALIEEAAAERAGISCHLRRVLLAEPLRPRSDSAPLVAVLTARAEAALGKPVPAMGVPLYTDARHYSAAGIPTVLFGAGPVSFLAANAHRADEHLRLTDLRLATEIVALALFDLLAA